MSESPWNQQGTTLSHKHGCKEFGLTENVLLEAIRSGKLQYRLSDTQGNPWFRVLRSEVEAFARELQGDSHADAQRIKHRVQMIDADVRRLRRQLSALEKERQALLMRQGSKDSDTNGVQ